MSQHPTTPWSRAFAQHLRDIMAEGGVTQTAVAGTLRRSQAFVSERTDGTRPVDTDIIVAVAVHAGLEPRALVAKILDRMAGTTARPRTRSGQAPARPAHEPTRARAQGARNTTRGSTK